MKETTKEQNTALFARIAGYTEENGLDSAVRACELLNDLSQFPAHSASAMTRLQNDVGHTLSVCEMLIDLHIPLTKEEEDTLLAAVLLHIYPDYFPVDNIREIIVGTYGFAPAVSDIIDCITPPKTMLDEEQDGYYRRIEENKLALLAALADRGDIVSKLHRYSTWNAHRYIEETKVCYYPMCIYGKEHYHALLAPISVLMEKIRSLLEVAEILLRRYEVREAELIQDIQALREENATIKGIIAKFRASSQKGAPAHDSESQL